MKRIRTKLRGQEGASLILALLFFLLCMMVGASVLAAASSNAGKSKSRREEQQRYFTVSSALQLVAERLENAKYTARATVAEAAVAPSAVPEPPAGANRTAYDKYLADLADPAKNYSYTIYKQESGTLDFNDASTNWESVLPLKKELDWLFSQMFPSHNGGQSAGDDAYIPLAAGSLSEPLDTGGDVLTIKLNDLSDPALDKEVEGLKKNVYVTVRLGKSDTEKYRIYLTAELKESDADDAKVLMALKTELIPQGSLPDIRMPGTEYTPSLAPTIGSEYFPTEIDAVKSYEYKVGWKRGLIEKGAWQ